MAIHHLSDLMTAAEPTQPLLPPPFTYATCYVAVPSGLIKTHIYLLGSPSRLHGPKQVAPSLTKRHSSPSSPSLANAPATVPLPRICVHPRATIPPASNSTVRCPFVTFTPTSLVSSVRAWPYFRILLPADLHPRIHTQPTTTLLSYRFNNSHGPVLFSHHYSSSTMRPSMDLLLPSPSISLSSVLSSASPSLYSSHPLVPSRRMASSLKPTPVLNISFEHLSSELLALIFEQVSFYLPPMSLMVVSQTQR